MDPMYERDKKKEVKLKDASEDKRKSARKKRMGGCQMEIHADIRYPKTGQGHAKPGPHFLVSSFDASLRPPSSPLRFLLC